MKSLKQPASHWLTQKWGALYLDPEQDAPVEWSKGTHKKFTFICKVPGCDKRRSLIFNNVTSGRYTTCGNCSSRPASYWKDQHWGALHLDLNQEFPTEWGISSMAKFKAICDGCGQTTDRMSFKDLILAKSCGHCNELPASYWKAQTWGSLRLDPNQELPPKWSPGTQRKFFFLCGEHRRLAITFKNVTNGLSTKCGKCNELPASHWLAQRWGKLQLDPEQALPEGWGKGVHREFFFLCNCGEGRTNRVNCLFNSITSGLRTSCGRCTVRSREYWTAQTWGLLKLDHNQEVPSEWGIGFDGRKVEVVCSCPSGGKKTVTFYDMVSGKTKSCGCLKPGENEFSPESEVRDYVKSLASDTCEGSSLICEDSKHEYDVYIGSKKFAVEYHGLWCHSAMLSYDEPDEEKRKATVLRDSKKYKLACSKGDRLIQIYGDEWEDPDTREVIKGMIQDVVAPSPKVRITPTFEFKVGRTPREALEFLDKNHYLGGGKAGGGRLSVIARHHTAIVGVWVFKKKDGAIMWHRACWDRKYKSWNPHEKALKMAVPLLKEMGFKRMVTFSDNRFHTGALYEKLGFTFEEELKPDYYYTKQHRRVDKGNFRVPAGVNEEEAAAAKGWYRIYDSGKKRFSLPLI